MICARILLFFGLFSFGISSAIPIWELLTHQEKIGNLTFIFLHLVQLYCKESQIPDCEKVLALYGVSNLLKVDDDVLDRLDPNHRDSRDALWQTAMNGAFGFPRGSATAARERMGGNSQTEFERDLNTIADLEADYSFTSNYDDDVEFGERHPYAVRVPPPSNFRGFTSGTDPSPKDESDRNGKSRINGQRNFRPSVETAHQNKQSQKRALPNHFQPQPHFQAQSQYQHQPQSQYQHQPQLQSQYQPQHSSPRSQNSPIIKIVPYDKTSADARNWRQGVRASHPFDTQSRSSDSNAVYILPSDKRREPILLRILKK